MPKSAPDNAEYEGGTAKPGAPPRHATEPSGDRSASAGARTQTDPATGEPKDGPTKSDKV